MASQKHQHFVNRLTRFIKGSNAPEDREAFRLLFDFYFQKKHKKFTSVGKEQLKGELFQRIDRKLGLERQSPLQPVGLRAVRLNRAWWIAAALFFILLATGAGYMWIPEVKQYVTALIQVKKTVPPGEKQQYTLPDGTCVWLNAGSALTYPRFFVGHSREVALSGEAFFEVTHDAEHPFMIHSGDITTRVLGTSFNVKAYEQFRHTVITVATGRVQVSKDNQVLSTLTANQEISVDNQSGKFKLKGGIETTSRLAWQSGRLVFDNTPLEEVFATLSNQYNVSFNTAKTNLQEQYLTAEFETKESLKQILDVIIQINKLNFTTKDNLIVVSAQKKTDTMKQSF